MDLGAGPAPVMVDAQPEYEVDFILHELRTITQRCVLIGSKGYNNSETQWMSKAELKSAPAVLME